MGFRVEGLGFGVLGFGFWVVRLGNKGLLWVGYHSGREVQWSGVVYRAE